MYVKNDNNKENNQDKYLRWFTNLGLHPPSSLGLYNVFKGENTNFRGITMEISVREEGS